MENLDTLRDEEVILSILNTLLLNGNTDIDEKQLDRLPTFCWIYLLIRNPNIIIDEKYLNKLTVDDWNYVIKMQPDRSDLAKKMIQMLDNR